MIHLYLAEVFSHSLATKKGEIAIQERLPLILKVQIKSPHNEQIKELMIIYVIGTLYY